MDGCPACSAWAALLQTQRKDWALQVLAPGIQLQVWKRLRFRSWRARACQKDARCKQVQDDLVHLIHDQTFRLHIWSSLSILPYFNRFFRLHWTKNSLLELADRKREDHEMQNWLGCWPWCGHIQHCDAKQESLSDLRQNLLREKPRERQARWEKSCSEKATKHCPSYAINHQLLMNMLPFVCIEAHINWYS